MVVDIIDLVNPQVAAYARTNNEGTSDGVERRSFWNGQQLLSFFSLRWDRYVSVNNY